MENTRHSLMRVCKINNQKSTTGRCHKTRTGARLHFACSKSKSGWEGSWGWVPPSSAAVLLDLSSREPRWVAGSGRDDGRREIEPNAARPAERHTHFG